MTARNGDEAEIRALRRNAPLPALVTFRGCLWCRCALRTPRRCELCEMPIPAKQEAFRPLTERRVAGVVRYHRMCLSCARWREDVKKVG